jgi:AcrR family transcriptional regulator
MGSNGAPPGLGADGASELRMLPRGSQRERLLDGMARTVALRGYPATSVADVLHVAGVSRRTFYEQFADKEDCFLAAYDAIASLCLERASAATRTHPPGEPAIAHGIAALLEALAAEPDFARLGVVEVLAAGPHGIARRDATLRELGACIERHRSHVEATVTPPPFVAEAIVGGMFELLHARIARGETRQLPQLAGELLQYALLLIGSERPSR